MGFNSVMHGIALWSRRFLMGKWSRFTHLDVPFLCFTFPGHSFYCWGEESEKCCCGLFWFEAIISRGTPKCRQTWQCFLHLTGKNPLHALHHICLIILKGRKGIKKKKSVQFLQSKPQVCTFWVTKYVSNWTDFLPVLFSRLPVSLSLKITPHIPPWDVGNHPVRTSWLAGDELPRFTTYAISKSGKQGDRCCNHVFSSLFFFFFKCLHSC